MLLLYTAMIDDECDRLRFEDIYYNYRKQMLYVAQGVLHDSHEAEDAVQVALLGIARQIRSVPAGEPKIIRAYVMTAARNAALNMLPKKKQRDELLDISELKIAGEDDLFEQVAASQDYDCLLRAIRGIPPIYRDVLMLKYVQELTMKQIGTLLGRKPATVHQQITRGKRLLIDQCRKEGMVLVQRQNIV